MSVCQVTNPPVKPLKPGQQPNPGSNDPVNQDDSPSNPPVKP